ncbi:MAG: hypothetical protein ABSG82_05620 [Sedimentisphaerales bacterium]|jgi:hypothetical protein
MTRISQKADPRCREAQKELEKIIAAIQRLLNNPGVVGNTGSVALKAVLARLKALQATILYHPDDQIDWVAIIGLLVSIADLINRLWQ